jgi:hypothetical protein
MLWNMDDNPLPLDDSVPKSQKEANRWTNSSYLRGRGGNDKQRSPPLPLEIWNECTFLHGAFSISDLS